MAGRGTQSFSFRVCVYVSVLHFGHRSLETESLLAWILPVRLLSPGMCCPCLLGAGIIKAQHQPGSFTDCLPSPNRLNLNVLIWNHLQDILNQKDKIQNSFLLFILKVGWLEGGSLSGDPQHPRNRCAQRLVTVTPARG